MSLYFIQHCSNNILNMTHWYSSKYCGSVCIKWYDDWGFVFVFSDPQGAQQESERTQSAQWISVKEEPTEVPAKKLYDNPQAKHENSCLDLQQENGSFNLFLQKPSSFSKLSKLLEVAKKSGSEPQGVISTVPDLPSNSSTMLPNSLSTNLNQEIKSEVSALLLSSAQFDNQQNYLLNGQLYRTLAEKHAHWFSLLPRSPCDEFSLSTGSTNPSSCSAKASSPATSISMTQSTSAFGSSQNITSSVSPSATAPLSNFCIEALQVCVLFTLHSHK